MSSLICDRWLTHKLVAFMGLSDSLECSSSCHDQRLVTAVGLDLYSTSAKRGQSLALAVWGLDFWWTSEWGAGGGASLDLQWTCEKGSGLLAGEHHWSYSEPVRRGRDQALAKWGWTCGEPLSMGLAQEHHGTGRTHGMLCSTSAPLRPGTQSRPQVVQLLPFSSSLHTSAQRNL